MKTITRVPRDTLIEVVSPPFTYKGYAYEAYEWVRSVRAAYYVATNEQVPTDLYDHFCEIDQALQTIGLLDDNYDLIQAAFVPAMDAYQDMAIGEHLTEWPTDKTFAEIVQLVREGDESIAVWDMLEDANPDWLADQIMKLHARLVGTFIPRPKGE